MANAGKSPARVRLTSAATSWKPWWAGASLALCYRSYSLISLAASREGSSQRVAASPKIVRHPYIKNRTLLSTSCEELPIWYSNWFRPQALNPVKPPKITLTGTYVLRPLTLQVALDLASFKPFLSEDLCQRLCTTIAAGIPPKENQA